jgi:hypothetical protein
VHVPCAQKSVRGHSASARHGPPVTIATQVPVLAVSAGSAEQYVVGPHGTGSPAPQAAPTAFAFTQTLFTQLNPGG